MRLSRRAMLVGLSSMACTRSEKSPAPPLASSPPRTGDEAGAPARGDVDVLEWSTDGFSSRAAIVVPKWGKKGELPILVALHGRGEAVKSPEVGALGWPRDYALTRAFARACAPPLTAEDYEGLADSARLQAENDRLAKRPFEGLIVVCPHVPDFDLARDAKVAELGRYLVESLLPRVRREVGGASGKERTGIDGVSMGGHLSLRIGLAMPDEFGAVGALQAAIGDERIDALTELARSARAKRASLALRLTTSRDDYYEEPNTALSEAWKRAGVAHDFADVPGPHDYIFNRGPGAFEMLLWHDRVLRA